MLRRYPPPLPPQALKVQIVNGVPAAQMDFLDFPAIHTGDSVFQCLPGAHLLVNSRNLRHMKTTPV